MDRKMKYAHQPVEIQWKTLDEEMPPDNDDLILSDGYGSIFWGFRHNDHWLDMNSHSLSDAGIKYWAYKPVCPGRRWGIIATPEAADALLRTMR